MIKNLIVPVIGIVGVAVGAYLTSFYNQSDWIKKVNYEREMEIYREKVSLIEKTSKVIGKMPAASDIFNKYFLDVFDTTNKGDKDRQVEIAARLGKIRAELWSVMSLNGIYFGDSTRKTIRNVLGSREKKWWEIPDTSYNKILNSMYLELNGGNKIDYFKVEDSNLADEEAISGESQVILTSVLTILIGVLVFVFGRIIEKFIIEPIQKLKSCIGEVQTELIFCADVYSNPDVFEHDKKAEVSRVIRRLSSVLNSSINQIPFVKFFSKLKLIPNYNDTINAGVELMGLSNIMWRKDFSAINNKVENIRRLLRIQN
ncbi:MAG: hypothetical protein ACN6I4_01415 [bacterium]